MRFTNPKTFTVYCLPGDAAKYLPAVSRKMDTKDGAQPCQHGHRDCAAWERGPCSDEALGMASARTRRTWGLN